ncbi:6,7-dimethyl-8-ribityllumazine synthase [Micromonospora sp. A3M-1-15]|uniref:6,7-dimethyl-8-ribityllumazine synthase n=1 Tax=Micromonospora sp. A3M-1-15 TaxID=2962035 RepID=UPI0020B78051|nr:6,7-dimethyl-8-ribityllumazine synthase [Micromonospora sp. A3M-1-15]MCP3781798.1 6,7-dimethyl-8-ribityllumazine synthase [Micromonospora sp. A3M-1-15]
MAGFGEPGVTVVDAAGLTVGIVAARWHGDLTDHMVDRAVAAAEACGARSVVARVAGSVELPVVAQAMARRYDVVVALGVVVRGATAHFDYVCQSVTEGLTRVALDEGKPVAHGVLTVETIEQARDRAGLPGSAEDKGWAATVAALDASLAVRDLDAATGRRVGFA